MSYEQKSKVKKLDMPMSQQRIRIKAQGLTPAFDAPTWDTLQRSLGAYTNHADETAKIERLIKQEWPKRYGMLDEQGRCWKVQNPALMRAQSEARRANLVRVRPELCDSAPVVVDTDSGRVHDAGAFEF